MATNPASGLAALPPLPAAPTATTQSPVTGVNAAQMGTPVWVPKDPSQIGNPNAPMTKSTVGAFLSSLSAQQLAQYQAELIKAGYLTGNPGPSGIYDPVTVRTALGQALLDAARAGVNLPQSLATTVNNQQAAKSAAGAPPPSRFFKGGATEIGLTTPAEVQTSGDAVAQQLAGVRLSSDAVKQITAIINGEEYQKGAADVATSQAQQAAYAEAFQGGETQGAAATGGPSGPIPNVASTGNFATDLLNGIGAPVNASTIAFVRAWAAAEGNDPSLNNPLATTLPMPGATSHGTAGVKGYSSYQQGLQATIQTLVNTKAFAPIVAALKGGDVYGAASAITPSGYDGAGGNDSKNVLSYLQSNKIPRAANATHDPNAGQSATPAAAPAAPAPAPTPAPPADAHGNTLNPLPTLPNVPPGQAGSVTVGQPSQFQTQTSTGYPITDTVLAPTATIVSNPETPQQATADYMMNDQSKLFQAEQLTNVFTAIQNLLSKNTGAAQSVGAPVKMGA